MGYLLRNHLKHSLQLTLTKRGLIYSPVQEISSGCGRWLKKSKLVVTLGWTGTTAATSVRATALSSTAVRVVTTGSITSDDFSFPNSDRDVVLGGAKDRTDDNLDGFSFCDVADKEQHP